MRQETENKIATIIVLITVIVITVSIIQFVGLGVDFLRKKWGLTIQAPAQSIISTTTGDNAILKSLESDISAQENKAILTDFEKGKLSTGFHLNTRISLDGTEKMFVTYSAFTVAELGEMLPEGYISVKNDNGFLCDCLDTFIEPGYTPMSEEKTEVDARAKKLIYLLENKLICN